MGEVPIITKQIWQGDAFLNADFTLENLQTQLINRPRDILHLATHGQFSPGDLSNSFIQLWRQEHLNLNTIDTYLRRDPPLELLVLSACRTAIGDEKTELGFSGFAVKAEVKSTLASLWPVSDQGTLALMTTFYHQLRQTPIKAEALRQTMSVPPLGVTIPFR